MAFPGKPASAAGKRKPEKRNNLDEIPAGVYNKHRKTQMQQEGSVICENHCQKIGFRQGYGPAPSPAQKSPEGESVLAAADPVSHHFWYDGHPVPI